MINSTLRLAENAPGPFYVTSDCIDCDMCRETAPGVFHRHDGIGLSIVVNQPANKIQWQQALEALQSCPAEAIACESGASPPLVLPPPLAEGLI